MTKQITAFKLMALHKNGSIGSLFIHRRDRVRVGQWRRAHSYPTKGFAVRPGWHCCRTPEAPHLSTKGRVWAEVLIEEVRTIDRPECQGGSWYLADRMKVVRLLSSADVDAILNPVVLTHEPLTQSTFTFAA